MKSFTVTIAVLFACLLLFSPTGLTATLPPPLNQPPVADAGPDLQGYPNIPIQLQGSGWDPDTDPIVDWLWNVESSPPGSDPWFSNR